MVAAVPKQPALSCVPGNPQCAFKFGTCAVNALDDMCSECMQPRGVNVQPTLIAIVPAALQVNPQGVNVAPFGIAATAGK